MDPRDAKSPFLKELRYIAPSKPSRDFPFNVPLFQRSFKIDFKKPFTIIVGENGSGKSTLLESIAAKHGLNLEGGSRNHVLDRDSNATPLDSHLELSWFPHVARGFFLRAETFTKFATMVDEFDASFAYGGKSLHAQSHGESFLAFFNNRLEDSGLYILDEPEAALSPLRQLSLLKLFRDVEKLGEAQIIMATHSPILMAYPNAQLLAIEDGRLKPIDYRDTEHYRVTFDFLRNPDAVFRHLFAD